MTERHLSPATLQAYVMGDGDAAVVEAHVASCAACAAALAREARFEETLHQLADDLAQPLPAPAIITPLLDGPRRPPAVARRPRPGLLAALAAAPAAAAAAWLLLASGEEATTRARPLPSVTALPMTGSPVLQRCPSGAALAACMSAAQRLGLAVISESHGVWVPRYERGQQPPGLYADLVIP